MRATRDGCYPSELDDKAAERCLPGALGAVAAGEVETATERLRETFPTVCERERPEPRRSEERIVACHLYRSSDGTVGSVGEETTRRNPTREPSRGCERG